ncbi:MAG: L,D-transpeptidase family protein [Desulfomonilia bacterium]|jgi:murein L,D-transpeptidase YafK
MKLSTLRSTIIGVMLFLVPLAGEASVEGEGVPSFLIGVQDGTYAVCVDKSLQLLHVYNGRSLVKTIPCSTGMNPGDKQAQGDRRTPEGIYFFERIIDGRTLPDMYGWRAYTLNYPNAVDRALGKNGNGIWIHGRKIPLEERDTKGCVSLRNSDLQSIDPYLSAYQTPIVTLNSMTTVDRGQVDADEARYRGFVLSWIDAWQGKDIEAYESCYSKRFSDTLQGLGLQEYLARKRRLFERYEHISISTHGMTIVGSERYVLSYFLLDYSGDEFQSAGVKYVYLEDTPDDPKIIAEEFLPLHRAPQWAETARELEKRQAEAVVSFLENWRGCWEAKDLDAMKDLYLPTFPDREAYFQAKDRNLAPYEYVKIELEDVDMQRKGAYWTVTARQRFSSDSYRDVGVKTLRLVNTAKGLRVIHEAWEKIDENS